MNEQDHRVSTGISGLDEILRGGLPSNNVYLVQGSPGAGKTTLAMQFLIDGARRGERTLYITLLHARRELEATAKAHGWDLSGIKLESLVTEAQIEAQVYDQTLLPSSEVQLDDVMNAVCGTIERVGPTRLVFDSIDQLRLLAADPIIYRRKFLTLQRLLESQRVTALFTEPRVENEEFKTLAHGVITLDTIKPAFGEMRRRLSVDKMRGVAFASGYHSFRICTGGLEVYPRLPLGRTGGEPTWEVASSGVAGLDALFGGGLEYGTACLLLGHTGTGKSSLAVAYACQAARSGKHAVIYLFDERTDTLIRRSENIAMPIADLMEQGALTVHEVNIGELTAGQMAHRMRQAVEDDGARVVVIDSLLGYRTSLPEEPQLSAQLHEMLSYLGQQQVLSLLVLAEHGPPMTSSIDVSYLADTVVLLQRFETFGTVRLAVSVVKKRHGDHERFIREMKITSKGLIVAEPLHDFQGVLQGTPVFVGDRKDLMEE